MRFLKRRSLVVPLALVVLAAFAASSCRSGRRAQGGTDVAVLQPAVPTPEPAPVETPEATPTPILVVTGLELADPEAVTWAAGQVRGPRTLPVRILS